MPSEKQTECSAKERPESRERSQEKADDCAFAQGDTHSFGKAGSESRQGEAQTECRVRSGLLQARNRNSARRRTEDDCGIGAIKEYRVERSCGKQSILRI